MALGRQVLITLYTTILEQFPYQMALLNFTHIHRSICEMSSNEMSRVVEILTSLMTTGGSLHCVW